MVRRDEDAALQPAVVDGGVAIAPGAGIAIGDPFDLVVADPKPLAGPVAPARRPFVAGKLHPPAISGAPADPVIRVRALDLVAAENEGVPFRSPWLCLHRRVLGFRLPR